jgi:hypothetical protein
VSYIETQKLWKCRKSHDGKAAYRNFEEFSKAELGITARYVLALQKMKSEFTETQFIEFGPTRLRMVLEAAPTDRAQILDLMKAGATKRELERKMGRSSSDVMGASRIRQHLRGGTIALDLDKEERRFWRVEPVQDLLALSRRLEKVIRARSRKKAA